MEESLRLFTASGYFLVDPGLLEMVPEYFYSWRGCFEKFLVLILELLLVLLLGNLRSFSCSRRFCS
jgi:hypothetical protein